MNTAKKKELWLVAHDLTALGDAAATEAARLAEAGGARLFILSVYAPEIRAPFERDGKATFAVEEEKRAMLRGVVEKLRVQHVDLPIDIEVLPGDPKTRILEEAVRCDARVVVVGTHDRKGLARVVLGSVAEAVVHEAHVPVLVVKGLSKPAP